MYISTGSCTPAILGQEITHYCKFLQDTEGCHISKYIKNVAKMLQTQKEYKIGAGCRSIGYENWLLTIDWITFSKR